MSIATPGDWQGLEDALLVAFMSVSRKLSLLIVTLRGRPIARVEPFTHGGSRKQLGTLKGKMRIRRDLIRMDTSRDWEMLK